MDLKQKLTKCVRFGTLGRGDYLSFVISKLKFYTYVPKTLCLRSKFLIRANVFDNTSLPP